MLPQFFSKNMIVCLFLGSLCHADTTTPRMGLVAPDIGSVNWAPKIITDLSTIDSESAVLSQPNTFTNINSFDSTVLFPNLAASQCLQLDASHQVTSQACITPPGSDTQVIYNQGGTFAGSPDFTFNNTTITVSGVAASSMTIKKIVWSDGSIQTSSPTISVGPAGADGSSIYPSTAMPTFPYGVVASTIAVSTIAVSALTNSVGTSILTTNPSVGITVSSLTFADGTIANSTNAFTVSGTQAILNQSTLQAGSTFYVPLGTLEKLVVKSTFSVEGGSITLGTASSQVSIPTLGVGPSYVKMGSGNSNLTAGPIGSNDFPALVALTSSTVSGTVTFDRTGSDQFQVMAATVASITGTWGPVIYSSTEINMKTPIVYMSMGSHGSGQNVYPGKFGWYQYWKVGAPSGVYRYYLKPPDFITADQTITLPNGVGTDGQSMVSIGGSTVTWKSVGVLASTQAWTGGNTFSSMTIQNVTINGTCTGSGCGGGFTVTPSTTYVTATDFVTNSSTWADSDSTVAFALSDPTHKVKITAYGSMGTSNMSLAGYATIYRDSINLGQSLNGLSNFYVPVGLGYAAMPATFGAVDSPGDTSAHTYTVRLYSSAGQNTYWGYNGSFKRLVVEEIP